MGATCVLGFLPQRLHFVDGRLFRRSALLGQAGFDVAPAPAELGVGAAQRLFRIHLDEARQVDHHEQQIAQLVFDVRSWAALRARLGELGELLVEFVEHLLGILPIEADAGGARGDLLRFDQRGQGARHAAEQAGGLVLLLLSRRL